MLNRVKHILIGIIASPFLFIFLLLINGAQILSLLIRPFSIDAFRKFNRHCAALFWGTSVVCMETLQGVKVHFTGDEIPSNENAIVVCSHQSLSDVQFLLSLAKKKGRLQDLKWFAKDTLKYVPGVGWGLLFLDCVFLKRNWAEDQESIENTFRNLKENHIPMWLITFLEGTRLTPKKLASSQAYAAQQGWPIPQHVLIPRTKGFIASIKGLKDHVQAIYDVTIGYSEGEGASLINLALGRIRNVHVHVRRYSLQEIPQEESLQTDWTLDLFRQKDAYLNDLILNKPQPSRPGFYSRSIKTID